MISLSALGVVSMLWLFGFVVASRPERWIAAAAGEPGSLAERDSVARAA